MTFLLTGGAGYIGSHTAVEMLKLGFDVVIADNYVNSSPEVVARIGRIAGRAAKACECDVRDEAALSQIFRQNRLDGVIHFAGLKAVGESVAKPLEYYRNNLDSTMALLACMREFGVKNIIFSSSATVYGTPSALPLTEDMPTGTCTNPYGWTKLMIERILTDFAAANPDFSVVLLRYFNPVGADASGLIGEAPSGIPNNLMPYITQVAVGRRERLSVYGGDYPTRDGTGVRDYIHVTDLALGHAAAIRYCVSHRGTEIINLGTGRGCSVLELVHAFEKANGVRIPYVMAPRRPGDVAECWASAGKAERLLGWKAERTVEDMCRDSWRWQKMNPNGYDAT